MISDKMKEIIDSVITPYSNKLNEAASEDQIEVFEKDNSVSLPSAFKEWLLYSDGGDLILPAGVQFYGVEHKPLIDVNYNDRPDDSYIVIGELSMGDPILCNNGDETISIYNHDAGRIEDDEVYGDFYLFLSDLPNILGVEE